MIDAGELNSRVHLQRRGAAVRDSHGNAQPAAFETVSTVWAKLAPKLGGEGVVAGRLQGRQPYVVTVRYSSLTRDITPAWRLEDARRPGRFFDVKSIINVGERNDILEILAEEGSPS